MRGNTQPGQETELLRKGGGFCGLCADSSQILWLPQAGSTQDTHSFGLSWRLVAVLGRQR